jgi:uncharacterized protein (TIGR02996 family)
MSLEQDALLAAVREAPLDDLPRLALSDWCMEQPDEALRARGELIQLSVRAAVLPVGDPGRTAMAARARALRAAHERAWLGGLAPLLTGWDFERGMLLARVGPGSLRGGGLRGLARLPAWAWVIGLQGVLLTPPDVRALGASPALAGPAALDLGDCDLGPAGVRALAKALGRGCPASLKLGYTRCGDEGAAALAAAACLARLTVLELCNNGIGPAGAAALARSPCLGRLGLLDLSRNPLGDEGGRALAHPTHLPALRHLLLRGCGIGDRGGAAFADGARLAGLQTLDLRDNHFNRATRRELAARFGPRVQLAA